MRTTIAGGLNGLRFLPPAPTPLSLLPSPSLPLSLKRSFLFSNSKRKKHLEILTCLIALIIFIKRLIWSYHIPLISFAVYKCTLGQKETGKQSYVLMIYRVN